MIQIRLSLALPHSGGTQTSRVPFINQSVCNARSEPDISTTAQPALPALLACLSTYYHPIYLPCFLHPPLLLQELQLDFLKDQSVTWAHGPPKVIVELLSSLAHISYVQLTNNIVLSYCTFGFVFLVPSLALPTLTDCARRTDFTTLITTWDTPDISFYHWLSFDSYFLRLVLS